MVALNEVLRSPRRFGAADDQRKIAQDVGAVVRVMHFRMELHRPHSLFCILDARPARCGELAVS